MNLDLRTPLFLLQLGGSLTDIQESTDIRRQERLTVRLATEVPQPVDSAYGFYIASGEYWLAQSDDLWREMRSSGGDLRRRAGCLRELVHRADPAIGDFLVTSLSTQRAQSGLPGTDSVWRDSLLFACEETQFLDTMLRDRMESLLLWHAHHLRESSGSEQALFSALRRWATLIPASKVSALLAFLGQSEAPLIRQAALQAIQTIFSIEPPETGPALDALQNQVHALALHYLDAQRVKDVVDSALALNAVRAALVLDDPEAAALIDNLLALRMPHLVWLCNEPLAQVLQRWERYAADHKSNKAIIERLRTHLGRLALAQTGHPSTLPMEGC